MAATGKWDEEINCPGERKKKTQVDEQGNGVCDKAKEETTVAITESTAGTRKRYGGHKSDLFPDGLNLRVT